MEWSKLEWIPILQETLRILFSCTSGSLIIFQHAGYDANSSFSVTGFSQLHDDGTGGVRDCLRSFPHLQLSARV